MADTRKYIQAQKFTLSTGITTTDTSITLTSFNFPDGTAIAAGDIGALNYGTLEPGTGREEQISFTGFTTNGDGTVTLTGVTRGLGFGAVDTYSEQSDLKVQHGAGSIFILSNTAAFYDQFVNKGNDETMTGYLSGITPTSGAHFATKDYVDGVSSGNQLAYDKVVIAATAGESLAEGDLVYFDDTDNEWKRCKADTAATIDNVLLGTAQGAGTNGAAISGGVLISGLDPKNTGYTAGVKLYAGDTLGTIVETPGTVTRAIGWSDTTGTLVFDPDADVRLTQKEKDALTGGGDLGTPSSTNKFVTQDYVADGTRTTYDYAGSPHTWTKKTGLLKVFVQCWGGGASGNVYVGSPGDDEGVGGGGGGAYVEKWFAASELGATETITVGAGGAAVTSGVGNNGGDTTFGSLLTADGGYAGTSTYRNGGNGGIVLFEATVGGQISETSSQNAYFGGGSGARGAATESAGGGGNSFYGGAGGGGATTSPSGTSGGTSLYGGNGGAGAANSGGNATATSGSVPGGGGGGAYAGTTFTATSGAGANGRCIVTEFYA